MDYEKCFDCVAFSSIKGLFRYFNFGESFIAKMFLLFTELNMCTQNNGFLSPYFVKGRGVNQGCPASPIILNYCTEVMAHQIQLNSNIKGISLYNLTLILSQFADDTTAFLSYDKITLDAFGDTMRLVEANIGLKVSMEKSVLYRVGSLANSNARMYTTFDVSWSSGPIDMLGTFINCDSTPMWKEFRSCYG